MGDKYSHFNELVALGFIVNAMDGSGDRGKAFPRSDAEDLSCGARFIPGEVTLARRRGEQVGFVHRCRNMCCWYWEFQDGARIYHWDRLWYERVARQNSIEPDGTSELGYSTYSNGVGVCPYCGNEPMSGEHVSPPKEESS